MNWISYAILSAVFAAAVAIFAKLGLKEIDSTLATTVRSLVMAMFLVVVASVLGKWKFMGQIEGRALVMIVLAGVAGALSWLFYFLAIKEGPATIVAVLDRLSLVFVIIFAALFLGEAITLKKGLGILLMVFGAIITIF